MKRDIIIAVIIGFIAGSIIAVTAVNLPNLIKNTRGKFNSGSIITPVPTPKSPEIIKLEITNPQNQFLSPNKILEIRGKSKPGSIILLASDTDNKIKEASDDGNFVDKLELTEGINNIQITALDENGEYITKELSVYYTSEQL